MLVGDRLPDLRESKNLSQGDIEKRTGLLRCYVFRVENGHTVPAVETLEKFAVRDQGQEPIPLERWFSDEIDVRNDPAIGEKVLAFIKENDVKSVVATGGLIGCPHEEGIDYPEGKSCPRCPYWACRDRFTRERIH